MTYSHKHKGYILQQSSYNWHYMINKDGRMVCHVPCGFKLSKSKAKEMIDTYIQIVESLGGIYDDD